VALAALSSYRLINFSFALGERYLVRNSLPRSAKVRALFVAVPIAALAMALLGSAIAGAETAPAPVAAPKGVIKMVLHGKKLGFEGPETIEEGAALEIYNSTNPRQVGPHTFSLVTKGSLPKTKQAEKSCFTPKHICLAIAEWQHFDPKTEKVGLNLVKAGPPGWSTSGDAKGTTGDSWFTGETKSGTHITQTVTAKAGTTLYYVCAIHPWMQGSIEVTPAVIH
jgi:hypothetical protein